MPEIIETDVSNVLMFLPCYINPVEVGEPAPWNPSQCFNGHMYCWKLEAYRHSMQNYLTDVIARCDLQRETVQLLISSDIEQAVRQANIALL